jgi:hypothetical protein
MKLYKSSMKSAKKVDNELSAMAMSGNDDVKVCEIGRES